MPNTMNTLCVVDDDFTFQFFVREQVATHNLAEKIIEFSHGEDAINFIKKHCEHAEMLPDKLLLDIHMPVMDGWQFLEEYRILHGNLAKKVQIFIVSASENKADAARAAKNPFVTKFLVKPLSVEDLLSISMN